MDRRGQVVPLRQPRQPVDFPKLARDLPVHNDDLLHRSVTTSWRTGKPSVMRAASITSSSPISPPDTTVVHNVSSVQCWVRQSVPSVS
ncbi:hypothetical protein GSI_07704 [Ganoderma sinense ZZ0214-1]|uniref:Uncharacterized protein n=1 Tax=Ganoderma sinense ZZ0214-1 TaxID=1077348 RepID=A0A2G8S8R6_9APHY|nr:hypothetical protein GSI_07704 [Ganoderma sinense ZZ0214-1]